MRVAGESAAAAVAQVAEGRRSRTRREEQEGREDERQPAMRHGEVPAARENRVRLARLGHDEEIRRERHAFPHQEEGQHIAGAGDQAHGEQEEIQHCAEEPQRVPALVGLRVRGAVDAAGNGDESDQGQEQGAQRVKPEVEAANAREERGCLQGEGRPAGEDRERESESCPRAHHRPRRGRTARPRRHSGTGPRRPPRMRSQRA